VDLVDEIPVRVGSRLESLVSEDTGIVDEYMHTSEGIDCIFDDSSTIFYTSDAWDSLATICR